MVTILCVIGTRPEAIKMIPVIKALRANPQINCEILATAQHRAMLDQVLGWFNIQPDIDLNIMRPNQALNTLAGRMLIALEKIIKHKRPQAILAQGDTTTVLTSALSAFHQHIPFGHVEAGLRTHQIDNPFPEEMNRVLASQLTKWHFAPTEIAKQNLLQENISAKKIHLTGNTIVDMLRITENNNSQVILKELENNKKIILVTAHRRENFGKPLQEIFSALKTIADQHQDIQIIYPVHPNPNVKNIAEKILGKHSRIKLTEPLNYIDFLTLMKKSYLILSDSGGIQEEALALGKPVLLLRETTERPEGVQLGGVILVGHNYEKIIQQTAKLLLDDKYYQQTACTASPYGDGFAANKIHDVLWADIGR